MNQAMEVSLTDDSAESSDDSGLDTFTLIGIIGGVVVLALVGVIVVLLKKKPEPKKKKSSPKPLTDLPAPDAPAPAPLSFRKTLMNTEMKQMMRIQLGHGKIYLQETTWTLMKMELTGSKQTMAITGIRIQTELGQSG